MCSKVHRNIFSASTPYFIIKNIYIYSLYLVADELHVRVHVALEDAREGTDKPFEGSRSTARQSTRSLLAMTLAALGRFVSSAISPKCDPSLRVALILLVASFETFCTIWNGAR